MILTEKDLNRIAYNSDLTQREEADHKEVDIFLQPYYGTEDSGLTKDHAWIFSQINLNQMSSENEKSTE